MSRYLTPRQFGTLERMGDAFIPGDKEMPSFSICGCAEHVDEILDFMPDQDRKDLLLLLSLLFWMPVFLWKVMFWLLERSPFAPGPVGAVLRLIRIGLKGLIVTLYYSGKTGKDYRGPSSLDVIGYQVDVYTGDLP